MTKSTGKGRGGKRVGAGRKPKTLVQQARSPEVAEAAAAEVERIAKSNEGPASGLVWEAFATLRDVMANSPFPAPRVTAARAIIDLAKEERAEAEGSHPTGKKAQAKAKAQAAASSGGKFAPPSPPFSVVNGGRSV
jgi:hypothetical protein